jgi:HlyD family secretion protein
MSAVKYKLAREVVRRRNRMQRKWLVGCGAAVALVVGGFVVLPMLMGGRPVSAQGGSSAQTAVVEQTDIPTVVESSGSIVPEQTILLSFGTGGTVAEVNAEVGQVVAAGDVLAQLDTTDLEYQVSLRQQAFAEAQASYENFVAPPTVSESAQAQANLEQAESQLASAQLSAETAPENVTQSCASISSLEISLQNAQDAYDDYLFDGFREDANFVPDPDNQISTELRSAQSSFDVAQAQCDSARLNAENALDITSAQAQVAQAQAALDALMTGPTETEIAQRQAQLAQSELQLQDAQRALEDAQILAPFDGIITDVDLLVGQTVTSNAQVVTLVDRSHLYLDVDVDETDIARVENGQAAIISLNAVEDEILDGIVTRIAPSGTNNDGVVTYTVRVSLDEAQQDRVRPGMTGDVEINVGVMEGVLVVPTEAILRDDDGEYLLVAQQNGESVRVGVTAGQTVGTQTVVAGDLTPGQIIYIESPQGAGFAPPGF